MQRLTNPSMNYPHKKRKSPSPSPSKPSSTEPQRSCPRCDSPNTKFCYYNNYSSSQPRHFCRACRRYWTHGGALRNLPRAATRRSTKFSMQPPTAGASAARPPVHLQLAAPAGATSSPAPPWCFPGPPFLRQPTLELSTVLPMGGAQDIPGEFFRPPLLVSAGEEGDRYFSDLLFRGLQDGSGGAAGERRTPTTSSGPFD